MMVAIDAREILKILPHRYPFLLIDGVLEIKPNEYIKAFKNVSINEPQFMGHFQDYPLMPGVLVLEAMAQACCILAVKSGTQSPDSLYVFAGIDEARFKKQVLPGDKLVIEAYLQRVIKGVGRFKVKALVEEELVCSAQLICAHQKI